MNMTKKNTESLTWPEKGESRVPYQVYMDSDIYEGEMDKIFRGSTWNYLGLEVEIPNPGDYKTTYVGDTPVVVTRDSTGSIRAFVNRCAHRGATVCMDPCGNAKTFTCVYHAWVYDARGDLKGVPFKKGINGQGGMPEGFDASKLSLQKIKVDSYSGIIFGTFDHEMEPLQDYLGEKMCGYLNRIFSKPVKVLGYQRQLMKNNWKLYFENVKDSYHASLLHLFFSTFGVNRLSQKGGIDLDETGRHHVSYTYGSLNEDLAAYQESDLRSYSSKYTLEDPSLLVGRNEFPDGITLAIQSLFPGMVVQQIHNALAVRHLEPKGTDSCELVWTYLGFEDDDEELTKIRLKQSNLVGPAGFVSLEDGGIGELVQKGIVGAPQEESFVEMGGTGIESQSFRATETSIRGFWKHYRHLMGY